MGVALKASGYDAPMEMERVLRWWRSPIFFADGGSGTAGAGGAVGGVGVGRYQHRMQTTHSLWTAEPPVFPNEYPEFGCGDGMGSLRAGMGSGSR